MKSRRVESGSMDMLLDTMCNTFGGVCFIALMVTILSAALPRGDEPDVEAQSQMVARSIAEKERNQLLRRREELRTAIAIQEDFLKRNSTSVVVKADLICMAGKIASDEGQIKLYEKKRVEYLDELAKLKTKVSYNKREAARLARLLKEMEDKVGAPLFDRHRVVRTPKERKIEGLRTIDLWLHQRRLYLMDGGSGAVKEENLRGVAGQRQWDVRLVYGKGLLITEDFFKSGLGNDWVRLQRDIGPSTYVRIFTDSVSFAELCLLRDALISRNSMYNWILNEEDVIHFVEGYDGFVQ